MFLRSIVTKTGVGVRETILESIILDLEGWEECVEASYQSRRFVMISSVT